MTPLLRSHFIGEQEPKIKTNKTAAFISKMHVMYLAMNISAVYRDSRAVAGIPRSSTEEIDQASTKTELGSRKPTWL